MQFSNWWTEYNTNKHGQENVYIYDVFFDFKEVFDTVLKSYYFARSIVSRRILLSNAINSYREWAYLIQEEISNLSSTGVRFGTFVDWY